MERDDLEEVFVTSDNNEAQIVRNALHAEGIACEMEGEHQAGLTGLGTIPIKLFVRAEDYDRAMHYLNQHHGPRP